MSSCLDGIQTGKFIPILKLLLKDYRNLADMLYIYPYKADKKTFDSNKDELGFSNKPKVPKKKETSEEHKKKMEEKLE